MATGKQCAKSVTRGIGGTICPSELVLFFSERVRSDESGEFRHRRRFRSPSRIRSVASFRLVERPPIANRPPASSKTCPDLRNVSCNVPLTRRKSNRIGWNRIHHRSLNRLKIESFRSINLSLFSLFLFSPSSSGYNYTRCTRSSPRF